MRTRSRQSVDRRVLNELLFRDANEAFVAAAERSGVQGPLAFHCECSDAACRSTVFLSRAAYEAVRAEDDTFLLAKGHEDPSIEEVVERLPEFLVVRKRVDLPPAA